VFGFAGSFISLAISKWSAKRSMGVRVIDQPRNAHEAWLVDTVRRQAQVAGIGMPEVGIFDSPEVNAFATGARRDNALVAVSTGLLNAMSRTEAEAVLAHEVSHVANGDMVTLTLIQGVVNTFVIFISRVVGYVIDRMIFKTERGHGPGYWITVIVAEIVLGILATMIVMWFSRYREFRADAGGAQLAGRNQMIAALERLRLQQATPLPDKMAAFGINGGGRNSFTRLFMSHPPLEERIAALSGRQG
jgi:heat shock protein HtpX